MMDSSTGTGTFIGSDGRRVVWYDSLTLPLRVGGVDGNWSLDFRKLSIVEMRNILAAYVCLSNISTPATLLCMYNLFNTYPTSYTVYSQNTSIFMIHNDHPDCILYNYNISKVVIFQD